MNLPKASNFASQVDHLTLFLVISCSLIVFVVWSAIVYFCFKYRFNKRADRSNPPEKSKTLEYSLMAFILCFGVFVFAASARVFYRMQNIPKGALEIDVIAKQWMWIFHDGRIGDQINIMKVPIGRPVKLIMTSEDVIHSFYLPAFRIKQDILPGRYTTMWFEPNQLGKFEILCAQYCGLSHSEMRGVVEVVSQEEYDVTKLIPNARSDQKHGKNLFILKGCISCHDGTQKIGPSLIGLFNKSVELTDGTQVLADENYLRKSMLEPNAQIVKGFPEVMPTYKGLLNEEEIVALIEYIKQGGRE